MYLYIYIYVWGGYVCKHIHTSLDGVAPCLPVLKTLRHFAHRCARQVDLTTTEYQRATRLADPMFKSKSTSEICRLHQLAASKM